MQKNILDISKAPKFIAIEGAIGVGKSSLASKVARSLNCALVKENIDDNPFLEPFYSLNKQSALPLELHFLLARAKQWSHLVEHDFSSQHLVSDFILQKDPIFAKQTLNADEYHLYQQIYQSMNIPARTPDLIIYLQAPVDVLQTRIKRRGVKYEKNISNPYLQRLSDAYTDFFHHYDASPLLIVNSSEINPVDNEADYQQLLSHICSTHSGRHYLNPLANP